MNLNHLIRTVWIGVVLFFGSELEAQQPDTKKDPYAEPSNQPNQQKPETVLPATEEAQPESPASNEPSKTGTDNPTSSTATTMAPQVATSQAQANAPPATNSQNLARGSGGPTDHIQDDMWFQRTANQTPEYGAFELRLGSYFPSSSKDFFSGDPGLLWAFEADYLPVRIPDVSLIGLGFGFGWANYSGVGKSLAGVPTGEDTSLTLLPMNIQGVIRCDMLPRKTGVPLVFTGKIGMDAVYWTTSTAGVTDGNGLSLGLRYAAQIALEMDFLERSAAKHLDQDWGINHIQAFFEVYRSTAGSQNNSLNVSATSWAAGLGFMF